MKTTIAIGIHTEGFPLLEETIVDGKKHLLLKNMAIGVGFHWQKSISALLSGNVEQYKSDREKTITLIETLDIEDYIKSVVSSEMNPNAPLEFIKAHAIISRSWALGKSNRLHIDAAIDSQTGKISLPEEIVTWQDSSSHQDFDVCNDDHCQRYQGMSSINSKVEEAVDATKWLCLVDNAGDIIDARFSKCCGGTTEIFSTCWQNMDYPYLTSKHDPYCDLSDMKKQDRDKLLSDILKDYDKAAPDFFRWKRIANKQLITSNIREKFNRYFNDIKDIEITERGASERAKYIRIIAENGDIKIGKELAIRRLFSTSHLLSSPSSITIAGNDFIVEGNGWGHGVGLCQIGAARMAYDGASMEEILQFYYPGTRLISV